MKFRKKPVVVEAWQSYSTDEPPAWAIAASTCRIHESTATRIVQIKTPNGKVDINRGDWLIKGVNGEVFPCRADIFEATYERVEE